MSNDASSLRNAAAGLIGGAVGVYAMDRSMALTRKLLRVANKPPTRERCEGDDPSWSRIGEHHQRDESATQALARTLVQALTGTPPRERTQARLATAIHWSYGLSVGALFGLIRGNKRWLITDAVGGVSYGVGLWVFGDNLAVPLLGLSDKPTRYRLRVHAHALSGHLVYGFTTALATRVANKLIAH